jgi:hypothetical protein
VPLHKHENIVLANIAIPLEQRFSSRLYSLSGHSRSGWDQNDLHAHSQAGHPYAYIDLIGGVYGGTEIDFELVLHVSFYMRQLFHEN